MGGIPSHGPFCRRDSIKVATAIIRVDTAIIHSGTLGGCFLVFFVIQT